MLTPSPHLFGSEKGGPPSDYWEGRQLEVQIPKPSPGELDTLFESIPDAKEPCP